MTLIELASIINDSTPVQVIEADTDEIVAVSDGKDSVPEEYMDCEVTDITVGNYVLIIEIDTSDVEID